MEEKTASKNVNKELIILSHETTINTEEPDLISLLSEDPSHDSTEKVNENEKEDTVSDINDNAFTIDSLDSVKSGESAFKLFTFNPEKCTANVDKCIAFWKKIDEMDLKPVNCSLYKPKRNKIESEQPKVVSKNEDVKEIEKETETKEEKKKSIEQIEISWCEALKELKRRKLDRVAKVAKPMRCKMCEALAFESDDEKDQEDQHTEIIALNNWIPGRIKEKQKNVSDIKIKSAKIEIKEEQEKQNTEETITQFDSNRKVRTDKEINKERIKTETKIKQVDGPMNTTVFQNEIETKTETENVIKESCLDLMENIFKDVLAKMSEEIDAHVNVKELVSEIIATATDKIKQKKEEQLITKINDNQIKISEEKEYKIPPYSMTGEYPCDCAELHCKYDTQQAQPTIEVIKSARAEKKYKIKRSKKVNTSTQFPEEVQNIVSAIEGGFCQICGLNNCICKYIQENHAFT